VVIRRWRVVAALIPAPKPVVKDAAGLLAEVARLIMRKRRLLAQLRRAVALLQEQEIINADN